MRLGAVVMNKGLLVFALLPFVSFYEARSYSSHRNEFFYDLDKSSYNDNYDYGRRGEPSKSSKRPKTCKMYKYDDSEYEVKPYSKSVSKVAKSEKRKEAKSKGTCERSTSIALNSEVKQLIRENIRLIRENIKLANDLRREVEANTKAIVDLNRRLDEYERN